MAVVWKKIAYADLATTSAPGLCPTLSDVATEYLNGDGAFSVPAGGVDPNALPKQMVENDPLLLDAAISGDGYYSGICEAGTAGATLVFGNLCYLAVADSRWEKCDANAIATTSAKLGICVLAAANDGSATTMLLWGKVNAASLYPALTIGAKVFVGETAGNIQVAAPTADTDVIRVIGFANTADELFFCPEAPTTDIIDDTAGGNDAAIYKAASANVVYDHTALTTTPHGAVSAATASKIVVRDASARAAFAAPSAAGDVAILSTVTDHAGAADPHTGYRLESADHSHATTGAQGGQIDHGTGHTAASLLDDDHTQYRLESADHSHQSAGAQAGQLDHGLALTGLTDDDHTIYTKKATLTEQGDIYYASAASTPAALAHGVAGQYLKTGGDAANPSWDTPAGGGATIVRKTADETVNNSSALQNDDHLLSAVGANEVWAIQLLLRLNLLGTSDFKYAFAVPAGGAIKGVDTAILTNDLNLNYLPPKDLTAASTVLVAGSQTDIWTEIWGIYVGGANAGTLQLQWAQNTATAEDTKVLANSYMILHKLA